MNTEQTPITGNEDKQALPEPIQVLSEFYDAFNHRDLAKMANHWAQTDQIAMDNPVGGIKYNRPTQAALLAVVRVESPHIVATVAPCRAFAT